MKKKRTNSAGVTLCDTCGLQDYLCPGHDKVLIIRERVYKQFIAPQKKQGFCDNCGMREESEYHKKHPCRIVA